MPHPYLYPSDNLCCGAGTRRMDQVTGAPLPLETMAETESAAAQPHQTRDQPQGGAPRQPQPTAGRWPADRLPVGRAIARQTRTLGGMGGVTGAIPSRRPDSASCRLRRRFIYPSSLLVLRSGTEPRACRILSFMRTHRTAFRPNYQSLIEETKDIRPHSNKTDHRKKEPRSSKMPVCPVA